MLVPVERFASRIYVAKNVTQILVEDPVERR